MSAYFLPMTLKIQRTIQKFSVYIADLELTMLHQDTVPPSLVHPPSRTCTVNDPPLGCVHSYVIYVPSIPNESVDESVDESVGHLW